MHARPTTPRATTYDLRLPTHDPRLTTVPSIHRQARLTEIALQRPLDRLARLHLQGVTGVGGPGNRVGEQPVHGASDQLPPRERVLGRTERGHHAEPLSLCPADQVDHHIA